MLVGTTDRERSRCVPLDEVCRVLKEVSEEVAAERISHCYPPMILRRMNLAEACEREEYLRVFMLETARHEEAAVFGIRGAEFPMLVPSELHECALWYVRLPCVLEARLEELASEPLGETIVFSKDLMHAHVHAYIDVPMLRLHFGVGDLLRDLPDIQGGELPCLLLLIASGDSLVLIAYAVTDSLMMGLHGTGSCAGDNYRPYRMFTEEEIEAAKVRAKREGPLGRVVQSDGTIDLELKTLYRGNGPA